MDAGTRDRDAETAELLAAAIGPACHELRSPLAVVYGFARMLEGSPGLDDAADRYVTAIVGSAERLDHLLDGLSRLGRVAAGRLVPEARDVPLAELVRGVAALEANVERVALREGQDVHVHVDADWLTAALQGVVEALCFDETVRLAVSWTAEDDVARVTIAPQSGVPVVDTAPGKASIGIGLARMQLVTMGGALEGSDEQVVLVIPRQHRH